MPFTQSQPKLMGDAVMLSATAHSFSKTDSDALAASIGVDGAIIALGLNERGPSCLAANGDELAICSDEKGGVSIWSGC